jgi:hypothetical protein
MKWSRYISLVLLATTLIVWPTACRHPSSPLSSQPADLAQKLYADVMAHPTSDIPSGDDWKLFAPFLGKSLLRDIDIYNACIADEARHYASGPPVKLASLAEFGIFSGSDEEEAPGVAQVESSQPQKDGSVRVTVKLGLPQDQMEWRVVDVFVKEDGHFVLDDVVFPGEFFIKGVKDDRPPGPDEYLSHLLTGFCKGGTHWVDGP